MLLHIARENALLNKVKVSFIKSDIFNLDTRSYWQGRNYCKQSSLCAGIRRKLLMSRNVLDFEPHLALFVTDSDPLVYYNAILKIAENVLLPPDRLYFEINEQMGSSMTSLLKSFQLF